jgi:hypothetical protein
LSQPKKTSRHSYKSDIKEAKINENLHQFEMYKTSDRDTDALCPMPKLFAQLMCTLHRHPPERHLFLNTLWHNNILCSSTRLKIPGIE